LVQRRCIINGQIKSWTREVIMIEDEALKISMQQSIQSKNERLAKAQRMLRSLTPSEEDILRKGLKDGEVKEEN